MRLRRIFGVGALVLLGFMAFALLALLALDTQPGHRLIARQIAGIAPGSGLQVSIGRIDGSIYGDIILHKLELSDLDGVFLTSPKVRLDWQPHDFIVKDRLSIHQLRAARVSLVRLPRLRPSEDERPLLPDFDISIRKALIGHLEVDPRIAGRPHNASLALTALTTPDRARLGMLARSRTGGDTFRLFLDAAPDADRFRLNGALQAPRGGLLAGMTGLDRALHIDLDGKGRWTQWRGNLVAKLAEAGSPPVPIANMAIDAAHGRFRLDGRVDPARLVSGGVIPRLAPSGIVIRASAAPDQDRLPFIISAKAPAFSLDAQGELDRRISRLTDTTARIALLEPRSLVRTMTGERIRMSVAADGSVRAPRITYKLNASWFALGDQRLDNLSASGRIAGKDHPGDFTVDATFDRLTGAGDLVAQLSARAHVTGPLSLDGFVVRGQGTRLDTRMLTARADLMLDLATGAYDVVGTTEVPDYPIPGLGRAAVQGDLRLKPDPLEPRKLHISGPVSARLTRLDNDFLRFVFGGLPRGRADIIRTPDGTISLSAAKVTGPEFSVAGQGTYRLGQKIDFQGRGEQLRFGTLSLDLSGDISRPLAVVNVDRYTLGLPIENISATFTPGPERYAFNAAGATLLGEITATGQIDTAPGAVRYKFGEISLAGVRARGVLTPSGGVPVDGTLAISGSGVDGTARFSNENEAQRIVVAAGATAAALATEPVIGARRGTVAADILVTADGNRTRGSFDLSGARIGTLTLASADGAFDLTNGVGTITSKVKGRRGTNFAFDISAAFAADAVLVSAEGDVGGQRLGIARPARIDRDEDGTWRLAETRIALPVGSARLAGSLDKEATTIRAGLDEAGLGLLQLIFPDVPLTGTATGAIELTASGARLPRIRANLRVRDFARQSNLLSEPVDLALIAVLNDDVGAVRAALEIDGRRLGRFQARLPHIAGTPDLSAFQRIAASPVQAQLRYRGPAEAIWPLAAIDAIAVRGPLQARIDIGGTVGEPRLTGNLEARSLGVESVASGTVIEDIQFSGRFAGSELLIETFNGRDRQGGKVSGRGTVDLSLSRGFPINIRLDTRRAALVDIDTLDTRVTGPVLISNSPETGAKISGDLTVDRARYRAGNAQLETIPQLTVREVNRDLVRARETPQGSTVWQLDVTAAADDRLYVRGLGLDSEWSARLKLGGPITEPRLTGKARLVRGDYDFAGRRFELTRGEVRFGGAYPPDPVLNIQAEARVEGLTAQINIAGLSSQPQVRLSSVPALPQDEILSRVLFGTGIANLSAPEALQLAGAVAALQNGGSSALDPIGSVRRAIGIDRLRIQTADSATGRGTGVAAGEYLGRRTYVEVSTDTNGVTATQIEFALTRAFSVLGRVATFGGSSVGVRVSTDY
ncbi:translocation/assembly module TamB domain-containing protein [Pacificimonas sp. WHA3]|uniref:Translocation/assembly module TamB domain-containing protein n=1 Tax=Pacificimonas pallii TaxID=2827236 RepID=A0ABS6SDD8_9SPHN|nr:translocation/assembly module TamB domain-containing protein [Pacificimonas pallii]MBV7256432.1 translocation/assembly module TamB domain-containing protein [Pacificimonas pallii]